VRSTSEGPRHRYLHRDPPWQRGGHRPSSGDDGGRSHHLDHGRRAPLRCGQVHRAGEEPPARHALPRDASRSRARPRFGPGLRRGEGAPRTAGPATRGRRSLHRGDRGRSEGDGRHRQPAALRAHPGRHSRGLDPGLTNAVIRSPRGTLHRAERDADLQPIPAAGACCWPSPPCPRLTELTPRPEPAIGAVRATRGSHSHKVNFCSRFAVTAGSFRTLRAPGAMTGRTANAEKSTAWRCVRSLIGHGKLYFPIRDQGVAGSNPVSPTIRSPEFLCGFGAFSLMCSLAVAAGTPRGGHRDSAGNTAGDTTRPHRA
jgi:hypothetical protein